MNSFFDGLFENQFIVRVHGHEHGSIQSKQSNFIDQMDIIIKTDYGLNLNTLKQRIDLNDVRIIISYLYSRKYEIDQEFIKLIPAYFIANGSFKSIIKRELINGKPIWDVNKMGTIYGDGKSDSYGILMMANKLLKFIKTLYDYDEVIAMKPTALFMNSLVRDKTIYFKEKKNRTYSKIEKIRLDKFIYLDGINKLFNNNAIDQNEIDELIKNDIFMASVQKQAVTMENQLVIWAQKNNYNIEFCKRFFNEYMQLKNKFLKMDNELYEKDFDAKSDDVELEWFDKHLQTSVLKGTVSQNITYSLLHGHGFNIVKRIDGTKIFILASNPYPENTYVIKTIGRNTYDSIIGRELFMGEYYLFLSYSEFGLSLIHKINPKIIQKIAPQIYSPESFLSEKYHIPKQESIMKYLLSSLDKTEPNFNNESTLNYKMLDRYIATIRNIKANLLNNYDVSILSNFENLSPSNEHIYKLYLRKYME